MDLQKLSIANLYALAYNTGFEFEFKNDLKSQMVAEITNHLVLIIDKLIV